MRAQFPVLVPSFSFDATPQISHYFLHREYAKSQLSPSSNSWACPLVLPWAKSRVRWSPSTIYPSDFWIGTLLLCLFCKNMNMRITRGRAK